MLRIALCDDDEKFTWKFETMLLSISGGIGMREERLVVRPFEDLQVLDYTSTQQINEHAHAEIKGLIPFNKKDAYVENANRQLWVQVIAISGDKEDILFYGIVDHLQIEVNNGVCFIRINISSGTVLMDFEEHIRSFQSEKFSYSDLLDVCGKTYENAAKIMTEGKDRRIPHFIMQYRETDWTFIKRLAAMNRTVIFADCSTKGEKYHFGIPNRKAEGDEQITEYKTLHDMEDYWKKKKSGLVIRPEDTMSYIWESREKHKLGEIKSIDGKNVFIWKIESHLKGNELYHTCSMKSRSGFQVLMQQNTYLSGVSLSGRVKRVNQEKVQIEIICDEYGHKDRLGWFSFSSIYSSSDGTGWYCMPEIDDIVRLYFPTDREQDAYVASAYHEESSELRMRPECKFWRNKEGKEIQLSPGRILMTDNDGTYIELSDEKGLEMVSEGSISIWAGGNLKVSAGSSIELSAPNEVTLRQGNTKMNLGGDIVMQGAKVML